MISNFIHPLSFTDVDSKFAVGVAVDIDFGLEVMLPSMFIFKFR